MIQVYTGNGKGKTTCALGLALRAVGAGLKVYIIQFIKGRHYSEIKALEKIKNIKIEQCGRGCFIKDKPSPKDILLAKTGLVKIRKAILSRRFNLIILDEINVALHLKLLNTEDILNLIAITPKNIELVLTGRYAPTSIRKIADLVSEIKEVKHYFKNGVKARKGIEF